MPIALRRLARARASATVVSATTAVTAVCIAIAVASVSAGADANGVTYSVSGPGTKRVRGELKVSVDWTRPAADPTVTPPVLDRIRISSPVMRFDGDANGLKTCKATIRNDGFATKCPRGSAVGHGRVTGNLGVPGEPADKFGSLSFVTGTFKLYNYRHSRSRPARLLAVVESTTPVPGVAINILIPVSRDGTAEVDVPDVPELPKQISNIYPAGTRLAATGFSVKIDGPARRGHRPFLSRSKRGQLALSVEPIDEQPTGSAAPPAMP